MAYKLTNQKQVRQAFKDCLEDLKHSEYGNLTPTDIRCAFVDYVDMLQKDGLISEKLASRVTLKG